MLLRCGQLTEGIMVIQTGHVWAIRNSVLKLNFREKNLKIEVVFSQCPNDNHFVCSQSRLSNTKGFGVIVLMNFFIRKYKIFNFQYV